MIKAEETAVVERLHKLCPEIRQMGIQVHVLRKGGRY